MKNWKQIEFNIVFGPDAKEKEKIKRYAHKSKLWAVHRSYYHRSKKYCNNNWVISHIPIGVALKSGFKKRKHAIYVFEKICETFPALLTCKDQNYWDVILRFYGSHVKRYLELYQQEIEQKEK